MSIVVSDTSPIRALDHLGHLDLLTRLFEAIYVPPAVQHELSQPRKRFRPVDVLRVSGVALRSPSDREHVRQLLTQLQRGEAEAIALAKEMNVPVLIDERAGRTVALRLGLQVTGVIGVLARAKQMKLIPAVMPLLERLTRELDFFISPALLARVRKDVGE